MEDEEKYEENAYIETLDTFLAHDYHYLHNVFTVTDITFILKSKPRFLQDRVV